MCLKPQTRPASYRISLGLIAIELGGGLGEIVYGDPALNLKDSFVFGPDAWYRLDFRFDFGSQTIDVFLNGQIYAASLPFSQESNAFGGFDLEFVPGSGLGPVYFDNLNVQSKERDDAQIYVHRSVDHGSIWSDKVQVSAPGDINQGISLAAVGDRALAVWRRFTPPLATVRQDAILYAYLNRRRRELGSGRGHR